MNKVYFMSPLSVCKGPFRHKKRGVHCTPLRLSIKPANAKISKNKIE